MINTLPQSLIESAKKILTESNKKNYCGNCVNSFDDNGESINSDIPYNDSSHFANEVQEYESGGNQEKHKINRNEFLNNVNLYKTHEKLIDKKTTEFLYDRDNDQYMLYDGKKDIHHFYS